MEHFELLVGLVVGAVPAYHVGRAVGLKQAVTALTNALVDNIRNNMEMKK